ncbi:hypothetical protein EVAR_5057_1 [Eumeta japonica]|uniref:Uncharacterized protein n=1 Tax=Eumeta variegata TaxID=151549 RepID=A0A4C1SX34_EUMVA|nr:hypothetical protein EVAR_5057_1 [Eumeta japonica]
MQNEWGNSPTRFSAKRELTALFLRDEKHAVETVIARPKLQWNDKGSFRRREKRVNILITLNFKRYTRSELVNHVNSPLLQHEHFRNIRGMSSEQDVMRHCAMEAAKIN